MNSNFEKNFSSGVALFFFYISPFLINGSIFSYKKDYIKMKGGIATGISKDIFITIFILFFLILTYNIIKTLYKINNKYKSISDLTCKIILSPFLFIWIITIIYQNFSMQYFDFRILIVLYILLFFSQYLFVKKIRENNNTNT